MQNQIPKNWQKENLENLLDLLIDHRGITPKKLGGDWSVSGLPALSAKNIKTGKIVNEQDIRFVSQKLYEKWMPEKLENGDILVTSEAPLGELYFLKEKKDYVLSQRLFALRTNRKKLNSRYLYYYLAGSIGRQELLRRLSGTAAEGIRQAELRKINVEFPKDILEQEKIASVISAFDDKIEVNNKIAKTLEEMAQTIFKEWFVKFKFPGHEEAKFVGSESGKIPGEWKIGKFADVAQVSPSTNIGRSSIIPYVEMKNLPEKGMWFDYERQREFSGSGSKFQNYDVLLARITPCLENGKTGYAQCLGEGELGWGSTEFLILRAKNEWFREWLYLLSRSKHFRSYSIGAMVGSSGRQRVPTESIEKYQVIVPEEKPVKEFHSFAEPVFTKIKNISLENKKLTALRDLLSPKLMRGEIRV